MHQKIIEAVRERYSDDLESIRRAKKSGFFELILVAIGQYDLLKRILKHLEDKGPGNGNG